MRPKSLPSVQKNQRDYYSGKKKQHTLKAQVMVHWQKDLIVDVQTYKEPIHDFKLYNDNYLNWLPDDTKLLADSGYQDIAKLHHI